MARIQGLAGGNVLAARARAARRRARRAGGDALSARSRLGLGPDFYARPVVEVARDLIGCTVEHEGAAGVIVETEAYHHSEPACHAYVGLTPRTSTLFGPPGRAYVYRSYGIHALLNAVSEPEGIGAAVLIRALEPVEGIELMRRRRGVDRLEDLCSGPGKLTQALGIELSHNGGDLRRGAVRIRPALDGVEPAEILSGVRVGITRALELPWRFCAAGSRHVSSPRTPAAVSGATADGPSSPGRAALPRPRSRAV